MRTIGVKRTRKLMQKLVKDWEVVKDMKINDIMNDYVPDEFYDVWEGSFSEIFNLIEDFIWSYNPNIK